MNKIKKYFKYILWIVIFWIFSDVVIYVGVNSTYKNMKNIETPNQITIYQAEATSVNGRIKGVVTNNEVLDISGKYIKLTLYSKIGNEVGIKYIPIEELSQNESMPIDCNFKQKNVVSYKMNIVDKKGPQENLDINIKLNKGDIVIAVIALLIIS